VSDQNWSEDTSRDRISECGFAFQLAVVAKLRARALADGWSPLSAEYRWQHTRNGDYGCAGLVAGSDSWRLVTECRR
jgi:hypothetical protein